MKPGTYVPSGPLETHAFAMESLPKTWNQLSQCLAAVELLYRTLGLTYHSIPLPIRVSYPNATTRALLKIAFEIGADSTPAADPTPILIREISHARLHRSTAKHLLKEQNFTSVAAELERLDSSVDLLEDRVTVLQVHCGAQMAWLERQEASETSEETERAIEAWCSALPEFRTAVEMGFVEGYESGREFLEGEREERVLEEIEEE